MSKAVPVYIPLLNPNEPEANLAAVHVRAGQYVEKGEPLCTLETTKSTADLPAESAGFVIGLQAAAGQTVHAGALLCYLAEDADYTPESEPAGAVENEQTPARAAAGGAQTRNQPGVADAPAPPGLRISQPALALARQENLDLEQLPRDRLITESWLRTQLKTAGADTMIAGLENDFDPQAAIIVYGGGGHGKSLIDLLRSLGVYSILGVVDDGLPSGELVMGVPVLGGQSILPELHRRGVRLAVNAVGGIGNLGVRVKVFEQLQRAGFTCPALVHPTAFVEASASLSPGVQVFPHAYVGSEARLGYGVITNTGAVVSHNCWLGDYVNISPGALLAGDVTIGAGTLVGMGVTVNLRVRIGSGVRIGNSAVIKEDVPDSAIVRAGAIWPA